MSNQKARDLFKVLKDQDPANKVCGVDVVVVSIYSDYVHCDNSCDDKVVLFYL